MAAHVPRVYVAEPLTVGKTIVLPEAKRHHLATVLRLSAGDALTLFNDSGYEYRAEIERATRKTLEAAIVDRAAPVRESPLAITLVQSITAGDRMDYALTKAVELGAVRLRPVFADRGKIKLTGDRMAKKHRHWQAVAEAAAEQSGRLIQPPVDTPQPLINALGARSSEADGLVLALEGAEPLAEHPIAREAELLIGPESGLSEREVSAARDHGWRTTTVGPRVLRTETAGPTAITTLQTVAGDFADCTTADARVQNRELADNG